MHDKRRPFPHPAIPVDRESSPLILRQASPAERVELETLAAQAEEAIRRGVVHLDAGLRLR